MTAVIGTADARISILRSTQNLGELDPAIAQILDTMEDGWRRDPAALRWQADYDAYTTWVTEHGRAPETLDAGAAGLRPWLDAQSTAPLSPRQRKLCQALSGYRGNVEDPESWRLYAMLAGLARHGVGPTSAADRAELGPLLTQWAVSAGANLAVAENTDIELDHSWPQAKLATYLLFVARHLRQPEAGEPGHRFILGVRRTQLTHPDLISAVHAIPGWAGERGLGTSFMGGARRYRTWANAAGRVPRRPPTSDEERFCANWGARQRAKAAAGTLTPEARAELRELTGK